MMPRQGFWLALVGLVIAVLCAVPAFLKPGDGDGVSIAVMICILGTGIGLSVMTAGLATAARTGPVRVSHIFILIGLLVAALGVAQMMLGIALITEFGEALAAGFGWVLGKNHNPYPFGNPLLMLLAQVAGGIIAGAGLVMSLNNQSVGRIPQPPSSARPQTLKRIDEN